MNGYEASFNRSAERVSPDGRIRAERVGPDARARTWIWSLAIATTAGLAWLVIRGEALPFSFGASALITSLFCAIATILVLYLQRLPLLSFPGVFLGTTFGFTCSALILYGMEGIDAFRYWKVVDLPSIAVAMPVIMLAFSSFTVAALVAPPMPRLTEPRMAEKDVESPETGTLRFLAYLLYGLGIVIVAVSTVKGGALTYAYQGGYSGLTTARKSGGLSQLFIGSLTWFLPWSVLILSATARDRRRQRQVLLLALPALGVMFMAGDRGQSLSLILLLASCRRLVGFRMDWKRTLAVGALVAFLIPVVANLRQTPVSQWSPEALAGSVGDQVQNTRTYHENLLGGLLVSLGQSYQTLEATVMEVPGNEGYRYGKDYVSALPLAVPFSHPVLGAFGVNLNILPPSQWVKDILDPTGRAGPGYLQVAEAYLEFGALGVIGLFLLMGWGLTRLWRYLWFRRWDPRVLSFALIFMMEMLIWVRNNATAVPRDLVWGWLLVFVAPALLRRPARLLPRRTDSMPLDYEPEPLPT
jgi:O-antigen polysaccharide polymerase Wzy